jgi:uncharacterized protein YfkK (UPF0435 family)
MTIFDNFTSHAALRVFDWRQLQVLNVTLFAFLTFFFRQKNQISKIYHLTAKKKNWKIIDASKSKEDQTMRA